jgi:UDP-2,3-diacylglucosamine hydrolase
MSPDAYEVLPGALLISDAHYSSDRPQLLSLLEAIDAGTIAVPQLILMGDIFDLLFGEIRVTHQMNADAVAALQRISQRIPVLYLEGNHDYNLSTLFPDAEVIPLSKQPYACRCGNVSLQLAHGDFNQPLGYRIYTALIRNRAVLHLLGWLNRIGGNVIIRKLESHLRKKNHCHVMEGFDAFVKRHLSGTDLTASDVFIEGHYHQGRALDAGGVHYFNPSAFACNLHYAIVTYDRNRFTLQERAWEGGE